MKRLTIGTRLYLSVTSLFLVFAVAFIVFQQHREKQYKIDSLNLRLQDFNNSLHDALDGRTAAESSDFIRAYLRSHAPERLRLTVILSDGRVAFDNVRSDYAAMGNHSHRPEVAQALRSGSGSAVDRNSATLGHDYFYSATYYPLEHYLLRSALPYNNDLANNLSADQHYLWFALAIFLVLTVILYRFTHRLGRNITKLNEFAARAGRDGAIEADELAGFSDDELGETAERIVKLYLKLQRTQREQDVLKRQLTQNVAHELKTPVASIQGYLETIIENPKVDEATRRQFLERCYAQSKRLASLLSDMSTLNRMDDASDMMTMEDVDVASLVQSISRECQMGLQQKQMAMKTDIPSPLMVHGNRSLLYSIFRNLTDNAIAYAGQSTTITLTARREAGQWHFTFSDNGVGVAPEHLPRLFERFYRVDKGRSRKMGGTGLGLAIVKNAVRVHGGTISVSNNPTGGLRFDFTLR